MVFHKDIFSVHFIQYTTMWPFLLLEDLDIASYADDTTINAIKENKVCY